MNIILSIESSGPICSIAMHKEGLLLDFIEAPEPNRHGESLALFVEQLLTKYGFKVSDLSAVAVSMGPGSYTGLRIGVSLAKGLCYAAQIPLIGIDTLQSLAFGIVNQTAGLSLDSILIPMIDARRMEVYLAGYSPGLEKIIPTQPVILDDTFTDYLTFNGPYYTAGSGCFKLNSLNLSKSIQTVNEVVLSAKHIGSLAWHKLMKNEFEDLAYFEPDYLKEFASPIKLK